MRFIVILLFALLLSSCTTVTFKSTHQHPGWPGYISTNVSEFDGRTQIHLEPGYMATGNLFRIGARWNNLLPENKYLIIAEWRKADNYSPDAPLEINIDGTIISLQPAKPQSYGVIEDKTLYGELTTGPVSTVVSNFSQKEYWITKEQLQALIISNKSVVRVHMTNSYYDEAFEPTEQAVSVYNEYPDAFAKIGLKNFLKMIDNPHNTNQ